MVFYDLNITVNVKKNVVETKKQVHPKKCPTKSF
jgi:hypothetical protein